MGDVGRIRAPGGDVPLVFNGPEDAETLIVLAHGAGAGMHHPFMTTMADGLAARGLLACRFEFLYMAHGKKAPDRQAVLEETYRAVAQGLRERWSRRLILGGKSMGGRIASHVAAAGAPADALVFLGYPLHPPGEPDRLRAAHLRDVAIPMLFVEGTRDPFCPLDTLHTVLAGLGNESTVAVIDGGDHSFGVRKSSGRSNSDAWTEVIDTVADWSAGLSK